MSAPRTVGRTPPARTLPPPDAARSRTRHPRRRVPPRRKGGAWWVTPWLYLIAPLALLVTFTLLPVADMVSYSFTDWDGVSPTRDWVGLSNYSDLFTRPQLFQVFWVSLFYLGASVVQICAALYFATVLSFDTRLRNLFKGVLFFPYLINGVAVGRPAPPGRPARPGTPPRARRPAESAAGRGAAGCRAGPARQRRPWCRRRHLGSARDHDCSPSG
jgi:raffinose/stachyose/melibiose transport system permease protein